MMNNDYSPPGFDVDLRSCLCAFGTTHSVEFAQHLASIKPSAFECSLHVNNTQKVMSAFVANQGMSLIMMQIPWTFFDILWYVNTDVTDAKLDVDRECHPCLNQRMCKALRTAIQSENSKASLSQLSRNSANCEIRIPILVESLESLFKSSSAGNMEPNAVQITYIYVLLDNYEKLRTQKATILKTPEYPFYQVSPSSVSLTSEIKMLTQNKRTFLLTRKATFRNGYVLDTTDLRNVLNYIKNQKHEHFCLYDNKDEGKLYFFAVQFNCTTSYGINYRKVDIDLDTKQPKRDEDEESKPVSQPHVAMGGPFRVETIQLFLRKKCQQFRQAILWLEEHIISIEQRMVVEPSEVATHIETSPVRLAMSQSSSPTIITNPTSVDVDSASVPHNNESRIIFLGAREAIHMPNENAASGAANNTLVLGSQALDRMMKAAKFHPGEQALVENAKLRSLRAQIAKLDCNDFPTKHQKLLHQSQIMNWVAVPLPSTQSDRTCAHDIGSAVILQAAVNGGVIKEDDEDGDKKRRKVNDDDERAKEILQTYIKIEDPLSWETVMEDEPMALDRFTAQARAERKTMDLIRRVNPTPQPHQPHQTHQTQQMECLSDDHPNESDEEDWFE